MHTHYWCPSRFDAWASSLFPLQSSSWEYIIYTWLLLPLTQTHTFHYPPSDSQGPTFTWACLADFFWTLQYLITWNGQGCEPDLLHILHIKCMKAQCSVWLSAIVSEGACSVLLSSQAVTNAVSCWLLNLQMIQLLATLLCKTTTCSWRISIWSFFCKS